MGWGAAGNQQTAEIYTPEYLTLGAQPTFTTAEDDVGYAATLAVDTADAANILSVCWLAPCTATHHTDTNQRYIKADFTMPAPGQLLVNAPSSSNVAPPGYYMLFLVDNAGVPSKGKFIRIG